MPDAAGPDPDTMTTDTLPTVAAPDLPEALPLVRLETLLPAYLARQRWFGAKDQAVRRVAIGDVMALPGTAAFLAIVRIELEARTDYYQLPLALADTEDAEAIAEACPHAALAWLDDGAAQRLLYDATARPAFWKHLFRWWKTRDAIALGSDRYVPRLDAAACAGPVESVHIFGGEQSNSSAILDDRFYVKLYRRLEPGIHPETELLEHLTEVGFAYAPRLFGTLALERPAQHFALAIVQEAVPVEADGWTYALATTTRFLDRRAEDPAAPRFDLPTHLDAVLPASLAKTASELIDLARVLGTRTAEMHRALAHTEAPDLRPEDASPTDTDAFLDRVREELATTRRMLAGHADAPADAAWQHGLDRLATLGRAGAACRRTRVHGDYHLGQVIRSEGEFFLLDFEGEPTRSLEERRARDCPLRDVAGMLRSLEYAVLSAGQAHPAADEALLFAVARWSQIEFLKAYHETVGGEAVLQPASARRDLVWAYLLHKALYEVRYELSHRPAWTWLPLHGLAYLLSAPTIEQGATGA